MMKVLIPILALGLSTPLAAQAGNQIPGVHFFEHRTSTTPPGDWVTTNANLPVDQFLTGRLSSPFDLDVVALRDGQVFLFRAVARRDAQQTVVASGATGILILEGTSGALDSLIVSNANGLSKYDWDPSNGMVVDSSFAFSPLASPDDHEWDGARCLRQDGATLYALNASGNKLIWGTISSSGFAATSARLLTPVGKAIELMDWGNDSTLDVAVLAASKISVYPMGTEGDPLWAYSHSFPNGFIAVSRSTDDLDNLVWAFEVGNSGYLVFIDHTRLSPGGSNQPPVNSPVEFESFESSRPSALACLDWDGDGRDDIVVGNKNVDQLVLMTRVPPSTPGYLFQFVSPWLYLLPDMLESPGVSGTPAYGIGNGDLDGDGDQEVIFSMPAADMMSMQLSQEISQFEKAAWLGDGATSLSTSRVGITYLLQNHAQATHLQIEGWYSETGTATPVKLTFLPDVNGDSDVKTLPEFPGVTTGGMVFDFQTPSPAPTSSSVFQYFLREVNVQNDVIVWASTGVTLVSTQPDSGGNNAAQTWNHVLQYWGASSTWRVPPGGGYEATSLSYPPAEQNLGGTLAPGVYVSTRPRRTTLIQ